MPPTVEGYTGQNTIKDYDDSLDKDCKILSWITGEQVGKFEIALNLSYFGVLHNKEDSKQIHGLLKIFQKVIKEELSLREARDSHMGWESVGDPQKLRSHEFDVKFVCHLGDTVSEYIKNKVGMDCEDWILSKSIPRLLDRDVEKLATMKKSATGDLRRDKHVEGTKENERITCLEASIDYVRKKKNTKVMKDVGTLCKEIKGEYGGIMSNLFKKLQIGGVREIFVLEYRCRIVIHFLETISRVVCEELENEMLTKGKDKLKRTDRHYLEVMSIMNAGSLVSTGITNL
jgi:hypothetical protein